MAYYERIHPTRGGANGTDVTEFYRQGEAPETSWPVIEVMKDDTTYARTVGLQWGVRCSGEFKGRADRFATKGEALAYARGLTRRG